MSYEIIYGKQFVDIGEGKYIPLVLMGSNNCTMFVNGREILERDWTPLCNLAIENSVSTTREAFLNNGKMQRIFNSEYEFAREGSKWLMCKDAKKWIENCFKNARTIEEIREYLPYQFLIMEAVGYGEKDGKTFYNRSLTKSCKTTEEINEWIKEYEEYCKNNTELKSIHAKVGFVGIESLGLGRKTDYNGKCLLSIKGWYVCEIRDGGFTRCRDKSQAIVFNSADEAKEIIKEHSKYFGKGWRIVKAA